MYLSLGFYALLAVVHQTLATAVHGHHRDAFRPGRRQEDGSSPQEPLFTYDELWDLQIKYLDNFVYPANVVQAMSVNSTLFAEDVQGRIDITQTFDGRELNTEYIFGLFSNIAANSGALSVLGYAIDYEVLQFSANDRVTTTTTRFTFDFPSLGVKAPVMWNSWHVYNAQGEITAYDATLRWWEWALDELIHASFRVLNVNSTEAAVAGLSKVIADGICKSAMQTCNSTNTAPEDLYESPEQCHEFLTKQIRFGRSFELGRNTLLCRNLHQNMLSSRPSVHCPHIGPRGGGMCDDTITYAQKVQQDYYRDSFVPYGKVGKMEAPPRKGRL